MDLRSDNSSLSRESEREKGLKNALLEHCTRLLPSFGENWNGHNLVTLDRHSLSRLIYYYELYQKIVDVPGVICEFGVQFGGTLATLINLRGMLEPYNVSRKIVGFDTFTGFPSVSEKDRSILQKGNFGTFDNFDKVLDEILLLHEGLSPVAHIRKFELVVGDVSETIIEWLKRNSSTMISMAILDMDLYKPTRHVLEVILPRLTKGSLLVFDELTHDTYPGEMQAVQEIFGTANLALKRFPHQSSCAWAVFGE